MSESLRNDGRVWVPKKPGDKRPPAQIPENDRDYIHTFEGRDDMPAHIKSTLIGNSLTIPITYGLLNLGKWQGIYLCEHLNHGGSRKLVVTIFGDES
jgi:secondary thiamine-phosphate synthase enzyme